MADIDIKQPAKINRNTAADGDFLWEKDFKVLYENDEKLKNAIQQATQDYTAGDGIDIDPSTKAISVKTGTGIAKTDEGLSVNIEGKNIDVQYAEGKYTLSAFDSENAFNELGQYVETIDDELTSFENEVKEKYITSGNEMVPNHQYVYTTSGWADIGGEHATVSYWRPTYNESTGKLSWQMSPSIEAPDDALVKGEKGDDGKTPEFRINQSTNFWEWKYTDAQNWTSTNTSATGSQGAKGEQGDQGYTPEITHAVDTANSGIKVTISWPAASQIPEDNFIIPSGAPGTNGINGTPGTDGITPKLRVDSSTNRWQVSYDNGTNWADISPATSATGPKGPKGDAPTIQASVLAPTSEHTQGGVRWTIKYPEQSVSAVGDIWNGNNGTATVNCEGTYITGNGTAGNVIRPTEKTISILQSVSGKVAIPEYSSPNTYQIWNAETSAWNSIDTWWNVAGSSVVEYDDLNTVIIPQNGLSAHWNSSNTELKFGLSAEYEDNIKAVPNKIDKSQLKIDDTINEIKYTNGNSSSAISAVNYKEGHTGWNAQQLFIVNGDTELVNLVTGGACGNKGSIFFVVSGHQ